MTYSQTIFLAIVQGLTEFLPVSSSGHLVIFQKLFGLEPPVLFDTLIHVGTLGAILFYLRNQLLKITLKTCGLLFIGTLPTAILGLFLIERIDQLFGSLKLVGISLILTSLFLFSTKMVRMNSKKISHFRRFDSIFIGLFQALAILPGISRSGATIAAGLWRKGSQKEVFRFSFLLAIPAIAGALIIQVPDLLKSPTEYLVQGTIGMIVAGMIGFLSLRLLEKILLKANFWYFGIYCFLLGVIVLTLAPSF